MLLSCRIADRVGRAGQPGKTNMRRALAAWMIGLIASSGATAAVVTYDIRATGSTTVAPGGSVNYELTATVDTGDNGGLTVFVTSIVTNTGVAQPPITGFGNQIQSGWSLSQFGTPNADDLLNIGRGQINFNNYITGIGQSGPAVLAFGAVTMPNTPGTYFVRAGDDHAENDQSIANVATPGGDGSFGAGVVFGPGFNVTVQAQNDDPGGDPNDGDPGSDPNDGDPGSDPNDGDPGDGDPGDGDPGTVNGGDNNNDDNNNGNNNNNNKGPCGVGIPTAAGGSFLALCAVRLGRRRDRIIA